MLGSVCGWACMKMWAVAKRLNRACKAYLERCRLEGRPLGRERGACFTMRAPRQGVRSGLLLSGLLPAFKGQHLRTAQREVCGGILQQPSASIAEEHFSDRVRRVQGQGSMMRRMPSRARTRMVNCRGTHLLRHEHAEACNLPYLPLKSAVEDLAAKSMCCSAKDER